MNQLYVYIYPHIPSPLRLPPTLAIAPFQVVTKHGAENDCPDQDLLYQIVGEIATQKREGACLRANGQGELGAMSKTQESWQSLGRKTWILTAGLSPFLYTRISEKKEVLAEFG